MKTIYAVLLSLMPAVALAEDTGSCPDGKLCNPLESNITSFGGLFEKILSDIIIPVSVMIGIAFIVWAGFGLVSASGNDQKLAVAKKRLLYTIIGVAIVVGAEIILDLLLNTVREVTSVEF